MALQFEPCTHDGQPALRLRGIQKDITDYLDSLFTRAEDSGECVKIVPGSTVYHTPVRGGTQRVETIVYWPKTVR